MRRLNVMKCPTAKKDSNAYPFFASSKKARVDEPSQGGQPPFLRGPPPFLPPPPFTLSAGNSSKGKKVAFDSAMEEYLEWALTLYEDFLTRGLSQRIEMDKGIDLRHTLIYHTLMPASLVCKDVLETEKNDVERRELGDELAKAMRELTVRAEHDKQLAAEVWESQVLRKALELEVKESTFKINELQAGV
ncbi:hypothetical protein ACOSQ2_010090 [Xanthoceras sorbifolium]